jgi:signal transduction histidine kinase
MTRGNALQTFVSYAIAVGSTALAFVLNSLLPELENTRGVLFLAAVTVSAYFGGMRPGLLATVLSGFLLDYFFVHEIHAVDFGTAVCVSLGTFALVALAINSLHLIQRRLEADLRVQNRRQGEFMAVLAHELRNFLAPVSPAMATLRLRGKGDKTTEETCATVERQMHNMAHLVNDLLDVARINEGKVRLSLEPVDLAAVVAQAVEAARPLIEERQHQLKTSLPPGPLRLAADRTRLEQVLVNLLTNAAKYTDPGGRISLAVERVGQELVVRVRDNGRGLEPEILPQVFDLFAQAKSGSQGGLGIGLNLVRGLVEMHGGSVAASSSGPGQGSEFVVHLPADARR